MLFRPTIYKGKESQLIAHANVVSCDTDILVSEVESRGFNISPIISMKSKNRIHEWLSIRLLLFEMFGKCSEILYNETGKPSLKDIDSHISISHSKNKIAIVSDKHPTGVDIQQINKKLHNIQQKFLHPKEIEYKKIYTTEELSVIWSAKEAIYKVHGHPEIFLRDILLEEFEFRKNGACVVGMLKINGSDKRFVVRYELVEDYLLAYIANQ